MGAGHQCVDVDKVHYSCVSHLPVPPRTLQHRDFHEAMRMCHHMSVIVTEDCETVSAGQDRYSPVMCMFEKRVQGAGQQADIS